MIIDPEIVKELPEDVLAFFHMVPGLTLVYTSTEFFGYRLHLRRGAFSATTMLVSPPYSVEHLQACVQQLLLVIAREVMKTL